MINLFRKKIFEDYVDLTLGRVYIKPLTNWIVNKCTFLSMKNNILNEVLFYTLLEFELVQLQKKKLRNLSIKDGKKVRQKMIEILTRHGLVSGNSKSEKTKEDFSDKEKEQFEEMLVETKQKHVDLFGNK